MAVIRMVHPKHGMTIAQGAEIEQNKLSGWTVEVPKVEPVEVVEVVEAVDEAYKYSPPKGKPGRPAKGR